MGLKHPAATHSSAAARIPAHTIVQFLFFITFTLPSARGAFLFTNR
jgi:hypothetical protein